MSDEVPQLRRSKCPTSYKKFSWSLLNSNEKPSWQTKLRVMMLQDTCFPRCAFTSCTVIWCCLCRSWYWRWCRCWCRCWCGSWCRSWCRCWCRCCKRGNLQISLAMSSEMIFDIWNDAQSGFLGKLWCDLQNGTWKLPYILVLTLTLHRSHTILIN